MPSKEALLLEFLKNGLSRAGMYGKRVGGGYFNSLD